MGVKQTIGEQISEIRRREGFTQQEIAEITNVSQQSIQKFESGRTSPSFRKVEEIISAIGYKIILSKKDR